MVPYAATQTFLYKTSFSTQISHRARRAPITEAIEILRTIASDFKMLPKTILFYGNRRATANASFELNRAIRTRMQEVGVGENLPTELFAPFHAQLIAYKKQQLMDRLKKGELIGLVSTSALEMGIDIGDLSLCIMIGYGGSKASFLQQAGRVGRNGAGLVIQIFQEDPLEQYYAANPHEFMEREPEHVTIDVANPHIVSEYLQYAAYEQNGTLKFPQNYFKVSAARKIEGFNERWDVVDAKWQWKENGVGYNHLLNSGKVFRVVHNKGVSSETLFDGVDERSLLRDFHQGAVFLYDEKTYRVSRILFKKGEVQVVQQRLDYTTRSQITDTINVIEEYSKQTYSDAVEIGKGQFEVTRRLWGYKKVALFGGLISDEIQESNMYPVKYTTEGLWFRLTNVVSVRDQLGGNISEGSIHVAEHAIASAIPTIVKCSNADFGLLSSISMKEFCFSPTIAVYETGGGGAGIIDAVQERMVHILRKALGILKACPCEVGCPNCTHVSICERGNEPLDKKGGVMLLDWLLSSAF